MTFFQVINSSSSGNCAILQCDNQTILIDAGIGITKLKKYLSDIALRVEDIDAIFITHEHSDHCSLLERLARHATPNIYCNEMTAEMILARYPTSSAMQWNIFKTGDKFMLGNIEVSTIAIPHDSNDPVSYKFSHNNKKCCWLTDLGYINEPIEKFIKDVNLLVLESNYDEDMLDESERAYNLKNRIRGSHGHLSNIDTFDIINKLDFANTIDHLYLAHISKDCNSKSIISNIITTLPQLQQNKIHIVCPHAGMSHCYEL
ncbi:MAG: MBL fold metallo-hydrolase [Opitutales bacterium]